MASSIAVDDDYSVHSSMVTSGLVPSMVGKTKALLSMDHVQDLIIASQFVNIEVLNQQPKPHQSERQKSRSFIENYDHDGFEYEEVNLSQSVIEAA